MELVAQALIELDVAHAIGAGRYERTPERLTHPKPRPRASPVDQGLHPGFDQRVADFTGRPIADAFPYHAGTVGELPPSRSSPTATVGSSGNRSPLARVP